MSPGSASMLSSRVSWLRIAALDDARRLVGAEELERDGRVDGLVDVDAQEVDVQRVAADGVALDVLDDHGVAAAPSIATSITPRAARSVLRRIRASTAKAGTPPPP